MHVGKLAHPRVPSHIRIQQLHNALYANILSLHSMATFYCYVDYFRISQSMHATREMNYDFERDLLHFKRVVSFIIL